VTLRLLLVDDHPVFRDGLRFTLAQAPEVGDVDEASDGEQAVRMASATSYDVVVMDVRMPRLDGIEATRSVVETGAKVLVLTMFEDDATVFSAVRAGASGYLVKGADAEQVVSAVRAVADGHAVLGPSLAGRVLQTFSPVTPPVGPPVAPAVARPTPDSGSGPGSVLPQLSAREREVLELLAEGSTNNEIGARLFISPITVRNHVSRILVKLQVRDRREAMLKLHRG
jgi:DNA-binding NarL/FixJ family response regulator